MQQQKSCIYGGKTSSNMIAGRVLFTTFRQMVEDIDLGKQLRGIRLGNLFGLNLGRLSSHTTQDGAVTPSTDRERISL
jgi:hypothetical protein